MKRGGNAVSRDRSLFPILVKLRGRNCLVVGAGKVAAAKIRGLLNHGARVVVVSPRAVLFIEQQAQAGVIVWRRRAFAATDVDGAFLVIAATNSSSLNGAIFRACTARGILCNAVDDPQHCHFFYPAVVRRGPLQIAISTSGYSPALAARLRRELERQFGPEWGAWLENLGRMRRDLLRQKISPAMRRRQLLKMASARAFATFVREHRRRKSAET
jgi:precorrin-2 dehydrogenase / sirohydrochlorin ferrochelatase